MASSGERVMLTQLQRLEQENWSLKIRVQEMELERKSDKSFIRELIQQIRRYEDKIRKMEQERHDTATHVVNLIDEMKIEFKKIDAEHVATDVERKRLIVKVNKLMDQKMKYEERIEDLIEKLGEANIEKKMAFKKYFKEAGVVMMKNMKLREAEEKISALKAAMTAACEVTKKVRKTQVDKLSRDIADIDAELAAFEAEYGY